MAISGILHLGSLGQTENIDCSTAQGKLMTTMLVGFAEYFSDSLSTHTKKGVSERAMQGKHLGGIPFGYESCWEGPKGGRQLSCEPEHPAGLHPVEQETEPSESCSVAMRPAPPHLASWLPG